MKTLNKICLACAILLIPVMSLPAQTDSSTDRVVVKLSNPGKPAYVECGLVNGGITVTGYEGQEVIVEAITKTRKLSEEDRTEKSQGMFQIPVHSSSLTVEEDDNNITINTDSWARTIDVNLRVPTHTSLQLKCVNSGDIKVENVTGDLDINNVNGAITATNISGSVIAHALNDDMKIILNTVTADKPMAFSNLNGDMDITFPSTLKATVKIKNNQGDVFSDFEIQKLSKPRQIIEENKKDKEGTYRVRIEEAFYGNINGGGPEFQFSNFNGDIYIRKGK